MRYREKCCVIPPRPTLKRTLSCWQATVCGIGIILGAGIYALIGVGAGLAGPSLWLGFLIAGIIAIMTGLSYAELSSMFRKNDAEYQYVKKAYNKSFAWIIATMMIFAALFTSATVALGFGGYAFGLTGASMIYSAVILTVVLSLINWWGIKQSVFFNTIFTLIEAAGLLFIIVIGIKHWGSVPLMEMPNGFAGVLKSGALVFFSYIGFESIVKLSEETKSPTKNIPRAVMYSVVISTIIYVLVAVSAVSIVDYKILAASSAPLAEVAGYALGVNVFVLLGLIALCSTTNTVLMDLVTSSRQVYGMAKKKAYPQWFAKVGRKTQTPYHAVGAVAVVVIIMILIRDIEKVAWLANMFTFLTFAVINAAVITLRKNHPVRRPFKIPGSLFGIPLIPLAGCLCSVLMFVVSIRSVF